MHRRTLNLLLVSIPLCATLAAQAAEPLEDTGLTGIAGSNGVKLGPRTQQGVSQGPQVGHPSQIQKEKKEVEALEALDAQQQAGRAQLPTLGAEIREKNVAPNVLPADNGGPNNFAFPKSIDARSVQKPEVPASLGVFQQTNVKIDGGIRFGSNPSPSR